MYDKIAVEFSLRPRDVHTVPMTSKEHKWFYVFAKDGVVYIESGRKREPRCDVKKRRLNENECKAIYDIYKRRLAGEKVSKEATDCTRSQVYWYGIFAEMDF